MPDRCCANCEYAGASSERLILCEWPKRNLPPWFERELTAGTGVGFWQEAFVANQCPCFSGKDDDTKEERALDALIVSAIRGVDPMAYDFRKHCTIGWKTSREHWVRYTDSRGIYWWLHPITNQWVGEPDQINMPTWATYEMAQAAIRNAPEPPYCGDLMECLRKIDAAKTGGGE